jgi:hypothetical protein
VPGRSSEGLTGQAGIGILQLWVLISMAQLFLHAGIPILVMLVLFRRTLIFILILRRVDVGRFFKIPGHWLPSDYENTPFPRKQASSAILCFASKTGLRSEMEDATSTDPA